MSKIYEVTHRNAHGILKAHILNYLNECKENGYDILNIEICAECPVNFILSWPSKEEIISNGYENIIIHVICDAVNFRCINFIIGDLDDSYYDVNNIHEDQFETIPSIYIKNVTGDITIHNCCSFYTRYKCIVEYGIVECGVSTHEKDKYKNNKSTINKIEMVLSMIFSYTIPRFSSDFEIGGVIVDTVIEPIKLKENDNIKISSKLSMIIEK